MLKKILLNLQLFGEGGDGGDGGNSGAAGEGAGLISGDNMEASIPEKAKKYYQKAIEKVAPKAETVETTMPQEPQRMSYADLIKSDEYKDEHKAYMDKVIGERLKKFKGIENSYGKAKSTLDIVASKYGVDPNDENFLEILNQKIEADDSYYEKYAMEHDISTEDARRIVTMERKVAELEKQKQEFAVQEQNRQKMMILYQNAEKTKQQFPQFDLEAEMQDEKFRRLCAVNNGDTTSAYMACHWNEILPATVQMASQQIRTQTVNAISSNANRPIENGISSVAPSVVETKFKGMSLKEIREYAAEQRRKGR